MVRSQSMMSIDKVQLLLAAFLIFIVLYLRRVVYFRLPYILLIIITFKDS